MTKNENLSGERHLADAEDLDAQIAEASRVFEESKAHYNQAQENVHDLLFRRDVLRLRGIERDLKEEFDWYTPLEEILGVPVIGVGLDEFAASLQSAALRVTAAYDGIKIQSSGEMFLNIYPDSATGEAGAATACVLVTENDTLRPLYITNYHRLIPDNPKFEDCSAADVFLVGRSGRPPSPGFPEANYTYGLIVERHYGDPCETTGIESYDIAGQLIRTDTRQPKITMPSPDSSRPFPSAR